MLRMAEEFRSEGIAFNALWRRTPIATSASTTTVGEPDDFAPAATARYMLRSHITSERAPMSKGMNQKKDQKKKPAKTLTEKREVRKAKKADRAASRPI